MGVDKVFGSVSNSGPPPSATAVPPARASGKVTPLATPTTTGLVKNVVATRFAVSYRSVPTIAVAPGSAAAAGPPTAYRVSPE